MKFHRISISNFRNFKKLDVYVGNQVVIAGENRIGKTNLLHALRLVLDPSLPDSARQLKDTDFWDGLEDPIPNSEVIDISLEFTDFEGNEDLMAVLAEHLVNPEPMISRITYKFKPKQDLGHSPRSEADYEFITYGGDREDNHIGYEVKRRIPFKFLHALRNAERDLSSWSDSPLRPLLDYAATIIDRDKLAKIADDLLQTTDAVLDIPAIEGINGINPPLEGSRVPEGAEEENIKPLRALSMQIGSKLEAMVGSVHALDTTLGFSPTDPDRLIRAIRMFFDGGRRGLNDASLGSANLLYLTLKSLEIDQLVHRGIRDFTFLAIEEPEAHLHPHLQRLVYREFLDKKQHVQNDEVSARRNENQSIVLTTHSPHIISVTPLRSIVLLKQKNDGDHTQAASTFQIELTTSEEQDLERYLDVNRGELLFSKGVILVEGSAEEYLVPVFGRLIGFDFDELGISVCSVSGINFIPYVKLLGENGVDIPFVVITDLDPRDDGTPLGISRVSRIVEEMFGPESIKGLGEKDIVMLARTHGIFLNALTLEVELLRSATPHVILQTIIETAENNAARIRASQWLDDLSTLDEQQALKDITEIGKGRFAQRLASAIEEDSCPEYIRAAIEFIVGKV